MAEYPTNIVGGSGGQSGRDACPRGYMTGLEVGYADKIDNIRIVCGEYRSSGDPQREGERRFGRLGHRHVESLSCQDGQVVVGFEVNTGRVVDSISLLCAPVNRLDVEIPDTTRAVGGDGGRYQGPVRCGTGDAAVGISVRHGRLIDAFGLRCNDARSVEYDARAY